MLTIIDEFSRKCLAIKVEHNLNSDNVLDVLSDLFIAEAVPDFIRSDRVLTFKSSIKNKKYLFHKNLCYF